MKWPPWVEQLNPSEAAVKTQKLPLLTMWDVLDCVFFRSWTKKLQIWLWNLYNANWGRTKRLLRHWFAFQKATLPAVCSSLSTLCSQLPEMTPDPFLQEVEKIRRLVTMATEVDGWLVLVKIGQVSGFMFPKIVTFSGFFSGHWFSKL